MWCKGKKKTKAISGAAVSRLLASGSGNYRNGFLTACKADYRRGFFFVLFFSAELKKKRRDERASFSLLSWHNLIDYSWGQKHGQS